MSDFPYCLDEANAPEELGLSGKAAEHFRALIESPPGAVPYIVQDGTIAGAPIEHREKRDELVRLRKTDPERYNWVVLGAGAGTGLFERLSGPSQGGFLRILMPLPAGTTKSDLAGFAGVSLETYGEIPVAVISREYDSPENPGSWTTRADAYRDAGRICDEFYWRLVGTPDFAAPDLEKLAAEPE